MIRDALPLASEGMARRLIEDAVAGPPVDDESEHSTYRSYNLLSWISDSAPDLRIARSAFEKAQTEHPEYGRREHPDLNYYGSVGFVEDALPFTAAELHDLVSEDPVGALARLRAFHDERHALKGPTWTGALRSLRACVAAYPRDGLRVAQVLRPEDRELRESLIYGWDGATLETALSERVLEVIADWEPDEVRRPTCDMLSNGGDPEHPTPWHQFERARKLASDLWPASPTKGAILGGSDFVTEAINHPAGDLAQFWTKVVQWEWSQNESTWDGIPSGVMTELNRLASAADRNGLLARTFLASQLHFFFGADPKWCETRLLPLFDWAADPEQAAAAWQGFLTWGRWNDGLLRAGLLNGYITTCGHTHGFSSSLQHQLVGHLISIAMYAPENPAPWLTQFVVAAPEALRITWSEQVEHFLSELSPSEVATQWDRWIKAYWSGRTQSVPLPFTPAEASATASWVLKLGGMRSQAIDLALKSPADLGHQRGFLHRLKSLDLAAEADDWARLLSHLLHNTHEQQWGIGRYLRDIVLQLRAGNPSLDLTHLINDAMRLGATDAADW